jgi:hypothetical protein
MYYHEVIFAVPVGMSVCSRWSPMGGPAGMAKPNMAFNARHLFNNFFKVGEFSLGPVLYQPVVLKINYACRVVPPVLQAFKAFHENGDNLPGPDITDYAAHIVPKLKMIKTALGLTLKMSDVNQSGACIAITFMGRY